MAELACDELGLTRFTGEDRQALWWAMSAWGRPTTGEVAGRRPGRFAYTSDQSAPMLMKQALAVFECDGETGAGMNERSGSVETSET